MGRLLIRTRLRAAQRLITGQTPPRLPATYPEVEKEEWSFYLSYLREGMCVFDVGAHIGELTLLFSRFVRESGSVHAFEASASTFEKLQFFCASSGRANILANQKALNDREGEVELNIYDGEYASWNSLADRPLENYGISVKPLRKEKVSATTLDAYCAKHSVAQIDLLKIDVEGAEYQVLKGAQRLFKEKRVRCCIFEFGQTTFDMGNDPDEIESYLTEQGYTLRNLVNGDPVFPGRGTPQATFAMHLAVPRQ